MINKLIISILVFLMLLSGGLGMYSYLLNQQIDAVSEQLTVVQKEQSARISMVTDALIASKDELTSFRGEALNKISVLREELGEAVSKIDVAQGEMRDEIKDIAGEFSQSVLNASKIYQQASQSVVRITDGEQTIGTGFVLDADGHIVTAHHVVEYLTEIEVIFSDGSISAATIIGSSQLSDIAVLALESTPAVKPLKLADSSTLSVGEPVVTIGNPFDMTETLTSGTISQLNRFLEIEYDSETRGVANLIQFDAAVNAGNSGGPLLNYKGEVIGMAIARIKPEEGDGIYYAVSSNKLKRVTASLINQGSFDYPWLGIEMVDLIPQVARDRGLDTISGVLVVGIIAGSPAKAAGLKVDDIIMTIDGRAISDAADLVSYLGEYKSPGEESTITLVRSKSMLELSLIIGSRSL